ncbi:NmrA/HSCARG family protein [Amycolatopsis rifamycinica]|uniref:Nucleoside-diphosphate sugar epimerase n=1 Tax=Amycolatopsis rifamycinica TaxID=287986 RepID=A0A066U6J6_9PSEU|nr:NmrA/HSCARG family protein [Amycolatopsis rifamycinica]KDN21497.1 nucleoside-diphosphate sugar epimerase [Amycolatopsis rifamycinica]
MSDKKTIVVLGATGAQGGGLARAIVDDPGGPFAARAVTRNPGSPKARALAERGAEVVEATLDDEDSLRRAFDGAHGAFVVTNFWESMSADVELAQAATAARAAKAAGLAHVVWSTLEDTREVLPASGQRVPVLQDRYTVPHFDAKAEADAFFRDAGVPTTYLRSTFFWEGFTQDSKPVRGEDGRLVLTLPMGEARLAGIAVEDIGRTAYGIFAAGDEYVGEVVSIAGEHLTGAEYAAAFADALGEPVGYRPLTPEQLRSSGLPAGAEIGNMFQYYVEGERGFVGARDLDVVRSLNPRLQTFRAWLDGHVEQVRSAIRAGESDQP